MKRYNNQMFLRHQNIGNIYFQTHLNQTHRISKNITNKPLHIYVNITRWQIVK